MARYAELDIDLPPPNFHRQMIGLRHLKGFGYNERDKIIGMQTLSFFQRFQRKEAL